MSGDEATTVETRTTTVVDPAGEADRDEVIPEPGRGVSNLLWIAAVLTLCLATVALTATFVLLAFVPAEPEAAIDAATLVAVFGNVLTGLLGFYVARQRR
jgi:hypothetical protein